MKGISLHQPWAAGVALGHKRWETRTRSAPRTVRGQRVFLHAARTTSGITGLQRTRQGMDLLRAVGYQQPGAEALAFGAIVATARLGRILPIVASYELPFHEGPAIATVDDTLTVFGDLAAGDDTTTPIPDQAPWGDWAPGRWAWELLDVHPLPSSDPSLYTTGRQGWWEHEHPALAEPAAA